MVEVAKEKGYDTLTGYLVYLFDYWGNDIQAVAPYYGVDWDEAGNITDQLPPYPGTDNPLDNLETPEYVWSHKDHKWMKSVPRRDDDED